MSAPVEPSAWAVEQAAAIFSVAQEYRFEQVRAASLIDAARAEGFAAGLAAAEAAFPSTDPALPTVPVVLFADVIRARIRALVPKEPK